MNTTTKALDFWHNDNHTKINVWELEIGDFVFVQGFLFRVETLSWLPDEGRNGVIVRYNGKLVPNQSGNKSLYNTGYDNSTYGHNDLCQACVVKRELLFHF